MTPPPSEARLRWGVAFLWLVTGGLVAHPDYRAIGVEYLDRLGLPPACMWLACAFEVGLGVRLLLRPAGAALTWLQVGIVVGFTAVLVPLEPALLGSPFGVLTKNVPVIACIVAAHLLARDGWTTRVEHWLRAGLGTVWITEGLVPKILWQQEAELRIVEATGLAPFDVPTFLIVLGVAQIVSGLIVLFGRGRLFSLTLGVQLFALVFLPVAVGWVEPGFWVHPFGPLTKNVPILVGTATLFLWSTPFMSADWRDLTLVTFAVPAAALEPRLPPGLALDLDEAGRAKISFVTLTLDRIRIFHLPTPVRSFEDVNLRFYVHRPLPDGSRRHGVVFARELVPSRLAARAARVLFGEPFEYADVRRSVTDADGQRTIDCTIGLRGTHTLSARMSADTTIPPETSEEHFLKERYFGFGTDRRGRRVEFRVHHPVWAVHHVRDLRLNVDWTALYGEEFAFLTDLEPYSITATPGSAAEIYYPV